MHKMYALKYNNKDEILIGAPKTEAAREMGCRLTPYEATATTTTTIKHSPSWRLRSDV